MPTSSYSDPELHSYSDPELHDPELHSPIFLGTLIWGYGALRFR